MLKFYKTMTLLNTMDRILYESQRQVCRPGAARRMPGGAGMAGGRTPAALTRPTLLVTHPRVTLLTAASLCRLLQGVTPVGPHSLSAGPTQPGPSLEFGFDFAFRPEVLCTCLLRGSPFVVGFLMSFRAISSRQR